VVHRGQAAAFFDMSSSAQFQCEYVCNYMCLSKRVVEDEPGIMSLQGVVDPTLILFGDITSISDRLARTHKFRKPNQLRLAFVFIPVQPGKTTRKVLNNMMRCLRNAGFDTKTVHPYDHVRGKDTKLPLDENGIIYIPTLSTLVMGGKNWVTLGKSEARGSRMFIPKLVNEDCDTIHDFTAPPSSFVLTSYWDSDNKVRVCIRHSVCFPGLRNEPIERFRSYPLYKYHELRTTNATMGAPCVGDIIRIESKYGYRYGIDISDMLDGEDLYVVEMNGWEATLVRNDGMIANVRIDSGSMTIDGRYSHCAVERLLSVDASSLKKHCQQQIADLGHVLHRRYYVQFMCKHAPSEWRCNKGVHELVVSLDNSVANYWANFEASPRAVFEVMKN
jgi:hypothetical protein